MRKNISMKRAQSRRHSGFAKMLTIVALLLFVSMGAWAQPWTSGDCTVTLSGGTLTVSGNGAMEDYRSQTKQPWKNSSGNITSVVVEEGVTHIGDFSFTGFMRMSSVSLPVTLTSIGRGAFQSCYDSGFTSVTIPANVTSIGTGAFNNCNQLQSITIPDGVTSIGNSAFAYCSSLSSFTIPAGVANISSGTFESCSSLSSITIPASVTSIDTNAFGNCSSLSSITIPANVTNISYGAFYNCTNLATVTINGSPYIGATAFDNLKDGAVVTMNLTANSAGGANWTTFYNKNYGFEADGNTEVFKVALDGTALTLNKVEDGIVDAGTAVVLKNTVDNPVMTLTTSTSGDGNANSLNGVSAAEGVETDGTFYVLNYTAANGVGFYRLDTGKKVGVGKAYLTYSGGAGARDFFGFGEETAIKAVDNLTNDNLTIYDLQGRRVQNPQRGVYIVNGRKVVIK